MENGILENVLSLYQKLPQNGKPRDGEYTVLSSIVATCGANNYKVMSLATGTKCIGRDCQNENGCLLNDSHAEVLARRGFVRVLFEIIRSVLILPSLLNEPSCLIEIDNSNKGLMFKIKSCWSFHLYISDCPCGDASLYSSNLSNCRNFGSKLADATNEMGSKVIGALRTKSGRSDIKLEHRTTSMSCSDKICRWICLGLQGAMLSSWLLPVYLTTVVVEEDPFEVMGSVNTSDAISTQYVALNRALRQRLVTTAFHATIPANERGALQVQSIINDNILESNNRIPTIFLSKDSSRKFSHGKAYMKFKNPLLQEDVVDNDTTDINDDISSNIELKSLEVCNRSSSDSSCIVNKSKRNKRKRNPLSPCGFSINWIALAYHNDDNINGCSSLSSAVIIDGGSVEVTIAHNGSPQGSNCRKNNCKDNNKNKFSRTDSNHVHCSNRTSTSNNDVEVKIVNTQKLMSDYVKNSNRMKVSRLSRSAMRTLLTEITQLIATTSITKNQPTIETTGISSTTTTTNTVNNGKDNDCYKLTTQCSVEGTNFPASATTTILNSKIKDNIDTVTMFNAESASYKIFKELYTSDSYLKAKRLFLSKPPFDAWLCDDDEDTAT